MIALLTGLAGAAIALATLFLVVFRGALSAERRIKALETKVEPFWTAARSIVANTMQGQAPLNRIAGERWEYLLNRLRSNQLTNDEAGELYAAFLVKDQEARTAKDATNLMIVGLGLALLKMVLDNQK